MATRTYTANFTGAEDTVAVVFSGISSNPPTVIPGEPVVTGVGGAPVISIQGAPTNAGCTVATNARFTGSVTLVVMD